MAWDDAAGVEQARAFLLALSRTLRRRFAPAVRTLCPIDKAWVCRCMKGTGNAIHDHLL